VIDIKHQRKILISFFGGAWPLRLHSGCTSESNVSFFLQGNTS